MFQDLFLSSFVLSHILHSLSSKHFDSGTHKRKRNENIADQPFFFTSIVFYLETCFIKREYAIRRKII